MEPGEAFVTLEKFSSQNLTSRLSRIEQSLVGATPKNFDRLFIEYGAYPEALIAAGLVKGLAGQINVIIHALGIILCLPQLLRPDEIIESASLGAGNTGKAFDLETNQRIAEFKFISWQGGPESIRQNSLFKDFYGLVEYETPKYKYLYVLGTEIPLRFFNGNRAIESVLSKNVKIYTEFIKKYPDYRVVSDYYLTSGGGDKLIKMQLKDCAGWTADVTRPLFVNTRPVASFTTSQDFTDYKLFHFDASASNDYEDGTNLNYRWDFDNDGNWETDFTAIKNTDYQYLNDGEFTAILEVKDNENTSGKIDQIIHVRLIEMIFILGGTFTMGDTWGDGSSNEKPTHPVTVSSLYMSKGEVTQILWERVIGNFPSYFSGANRPVEQVNWYDVVGFCNNLSNLNGLTPCYTINGTDVTCNFDANGYRLPTEAEWEFAARGGNLSKGYKYSGSNDPANVSWSRENSGFETHEVYTKQPNELGLYDMSGNVQEWCWDWFGNYSFASLINPTGPDTGTVRVMRGGNLADIAFYSRVFTREIGSPSGRAYYHGFRVVRR